MRRILAVFLLFFAGAAHASGILLSDIYDADGDRVSTHPILEKILPGTIVIMGEQHDVVAHHDNQNFLLLLAKGKNLTLNVGMEFFTYPQQSLVDTYVRGEISEREFRDRLPWGGDNFSLYRQQVLFPLGAGGKTLALNAPRSLTSKIAREGLQALSEEERALMPPNFELGNDLYFERFREAMEGHSPQSSHDQNQILNQLPLFELMMLNVDEELMSRLFAAQSTWDDTMAWRAVEFMRQNPDQVLFIIVGDFHAAYGGGLPDRIRRRGHGNILTVSQINAEPGTPPESIEALIKPHPKYGRRADFTWVSLEAGRDSGAQ